MLPSLAALALVAWLAPAAPLHDTTVLSDAEVVAGSDATLYIKVEAALDLDHAEPVAGAEVRLSLAADHGELPLASARTGDDGVALVRFTAPRPGAHELIIVTRSAHGEDRVTQPLLSVERTLLVLRTDRTQYQPGQSIRWRTTLLNEVDGRPQPGAALTLELEDPRGTLLWRGAATSDAHGMASGEIPMSDGVRGGSFRLGARAGAETASESLEVKRLAVPRFFVAFVDVVGPSADGKVSGRVTATYAYGEPVQGTARVICDGRRQAEGALTDGALAFTDLGCARGLTAEVRDGVDLEMKRLSFPGKSVLMWAVPGRERAEAGGVVPVTVLTTDASGRYLPASLAITAEKGTAPAIVASPGAVRFDAVADAEGELQLAVSATIGGEEQHQTVSVRANLPALRPLIDAPSIAQGGQALEVTGLWPEPRGAVVVTLMRDDAPIATALATVDAEGHLRARLMPAVGVHGLVDVRAVEVAEHPRSTDTMTFLAPETLTLSLGGDARHRPGARPELPLRVSDRRGEPVADVGLAVSVVDERALRLSKARVDLLREMCALADVSGPMRVFTGDSVAKIGDVFARLLASTSAEDQLAARAIIDDLKRRTAALPEARLSIDALKRRAAEERRIKGLEPALIETLDAASVPSFVEEDGGWVPRATIEALWLERGKPAAEVATPWGLPTDWSYARRFDPELDARLAQALVRRRLGALTEALVPLKKALLKKVPLTELVADGRLPARLATDPWGQPFVATVDKVFDRVVGRKVAVVDVRSAGPDKVLGTDDDPIANDVLSALHVRVIGRGANGIGYMGSGPGGGGEAYARHFGGVAIPDKAVRRRFDETVLWATGLTTGRDGDATITVPLADSVTGWRVQLEAVAPDGRVGALTTQLETFLPSHLEAEAPARLIVGDRYGMRVIAADHHTGSEAAPARLTLVASADGGLATEGKPIALEVPAGGARAATIELLAVAPGEGHVRVAWLDESGAIVDAVEQRIAVEPIGAPVTMTVPARLVDGRARFDVEIPSDIAARAEATVRVYRGLADVTFDALAGLLREPHGCFEQTSSTTHPNLLVLELLGDRPELAEVRAHARELVAKGYQRLASFEVEGGGFSLFGQAPASTVLTAYGLLELTDIGRVQPVDREMLARAARWLASQQKGDGTWADDRVHHGEMGGRVTTAFIAWALAETLANGLTSEPLTKALDEALDHLARKNPDTAYGLALWATAEALAKRPPTAGPVLARFAVDDELGRSYPAGPGGTAMYATGPLATVQATALAVMALARSGAISDAGRAVDWLLATRTRGDGWGSSHGVMLALRAAAILEGGGAVPDPGPLALEVDGRRAGSLAVSGAEVPTATLEPLAAGPHTVTLAGEARGLRVDLRLAWRSASAPIAVADGFEVRVSGPTGAKVGELLRQTVTITNPGTAAIAMPTAVIPIPAGWRASDDAIGRLLSVPGVASAEDVGDALHVYFETLAAGATVELPVTLVADVKCAVTQRPITVYAYYDPMTRGATPPARLGAR